MSDLWSPIAEVHSTIAQLSATGAQGHVVQIMTRRRNAFFRADRIHRAGRTTITAGRAETWRDDYASRIARHRAEIRLETDRLGWSFIIHRTDRPASELLLKLHEQLGAGRDGTGINRWHALGQPERRA